MDQHERQIIDDLFDRLGEAERRAAPRDAEAERLIQGRLARQPAAPYYMAQAIVVQQEALARAQTRIEQLEREGSAGGGFLGGLFGGGERTARRTPTSSQTRARGPWSQPYGGGGGFLAGAAQTAMGVAGGVLIGNALAGLFAPDEAAAAETGGAEETPADEEYGAAEDFDSGLDDF
jgi:hypothetical protein